MIPDFPRRGALIQLLETLLVLKSVHALPKAVVLVRQQSLFLDQALERFAYQFFARLNVPENLCMFVKIISIRASLILLPTYHLAAK